MKRLLLTFLLSFLTLPLIAQCPSSGFIQLLSQEDVDSFLVEYPNCTEIFQELQINGLDITNLAGLQNLTAVESLSIINNDNLESLDGLQNLESVVGTHFRISNNPALQNLDGLSGLTTVDGLSFDISFNASLSQIDGLANASIITSEFTVAHNAVLENLNGLVGISEIIDAPLFNIVYNASLISISGLSNAQITGAGQFSISHNNSLTSLQGLDGAYGFIDILEVSNNNALQNISALSGISVAGMIVILDNPVLTSLDGLDGIESGYNNFLSFDIINNNQLVNISALNGIDQNLISDFSLFNNPNLSECSSFWLCNLIGNTTNAFLDIYNNAPGCNSIEEVEENCVACPSGDLILNSQDDVNAISINYPDCSIISGLVIEGSDITDLTPLSNISEVLGNIIIQNNTVLENLQGLENLVSYSGEELIISNNPELTSIEGLSNLVNAASDINTFVKVENNSSLNSLEGLQSVDFSSIGEVYIVNNDALENLIGLEHVSFVFSLILSDNENLTSLSGLDNYNEGMDLTLNNNPNLTTVNLPSFETIHYLTISNNTLLENISGLSSLQNVFVGISIVNNDSLINLEGLNGVDLSSGIDDLNITDNDILSTCTADFVCSYIANGSQAIIANNDEGCNSVEEVDMLCRPCDFPIVLSSQEEVDNFPTLYLNCPNGILNGLTIEGNDIVDLTPLNVITSVENGLVISGNPLLENLSGLEELVSVDLFEINQNEQLTSLATFSSELIVEHLSLYGNASLTNLLGFDNIQRIDILGIIAATGLTSLNGFPNAQSSILEIDIYGTSQLSDINALSNINSAAIISIISNEMLINLNGFDGLTIVESGVIISENEVLESLQGLNNLTSGTEQIVITANPLLTDIAALGSMMTTSLNTLQITDNNILEICSNLAICNYLNSGGVATINNNSEGCNSIEEIQDACEVYFNTISGTLAFDFNNDGCDTSDYDASNIIISTTNGIDTYTSITDRDGYYELNVPTGVYTSSVVQSSLPDDFIGSPDTIETIFENLGENEEILFCLIAENERIDVSISLLPLQDPRPGVIASYVIQYENLGTLPVSGNIIYEFDNEIMFYQNSSLSTTSINENSIEWEYANLAPFESRTFVVSFELFIPPTVQGGEELSSVVQITPLNEDVNTRNNIIALKEIVVNSYDPNDKAVVQGSEILEEQVGDYLDYLVRFQNTGTADALEVVVTDTLSENLDWSSFRILDASHDYRVEITNGNEIAFIFEDINLPPEEVDAPGSNGYIAFEIKTNDNLIIGDSVENTANIYFDFNEPIITNTVVTTVVEPLSIQKFTNKTIQVIPNPSSNYFKIESEHSLEIKNIELFSLYGQVVLKTTSKDVDISSLSTGLYLLKVNTDQGIFTKRIIKN